jgi:carbon monoxide dehydrogenase subunit G
LVNSKRQIGLRRNLRPAARHQSLRRAPAVIYDSSFSVYYLDMFQVRAAFSEQVEWRTSAERAREFFNDFKNYVELMPGVERITADARGVARWLIRAEVPVVGAIRQAFSVFQSANDPRRIEWSPAAGESKNFLRYSATFEPRGETTRIRVEQRVELRRQSARELHALAPLAGEGRLSAALQKGVNEMLQSFLNHARARLER